MSDQYSTMYLLITSYLPQILVLSVFPILLSSLAINFMRNPAR